MEQTLKRIADEILAMDGKRGVIILVMNDAGTAMDSLYQAGD